MEKEAASTGSLGRTAKGLLVFSLSAFGTLAIIAAMIATGGGHGTYLPAKLLFPFTMLSTLLTDEISAPAIILALIQFPVYGVILEVCSSRGVLRPAVLVLLAVHLTAAGLTLATALPF